MFSHDVSICCGAVMLPLLRSAVSSPLHWKRREKSVAALGNHWAIKVSLVHAMSVKLLRARRVCTTPIDFGLMSQNLLRREALQICRGSLGCNR